MATTALRGIELLYNGDECVCAGCESAHTVSRRPPSKPFYASLDVVASGSVTKALCGKSGALVPPYHLQV